MRACSTNGIWANAKVKGGPTWSPSCSLCMDSCPVGVVTMAAAGKHDDVFVEHSVKLLWLLAEMPATSSVS